uniref:Uncharacterized protein n=1 Tax=Rhizophora mucronata TaxID=61149 RepID=A0A2P2J6C5_RHIMU
MNQKKHRKESDWGKSKPYFFVFFIYINDLQDLSTISTIIPHISIK